MPHSHSLALKWIAQNKQHFPKGLKVYIKDNLVCFDWIPEKGDNAVAFYQSVDLNQHESLLKWDLSEILKISLQVASYGRDSSTLAA